MAEHDELTDAAKAEIAAAVAIVKEDKLYGYVRSTTRPKDPPPEPPKPADPPAPEPPKPADPPAPETPPGAPEPPPAKPPAEPAGKKAKRSLYWGDRLDDNE